jgi:tetratricopeptide (TPR) repeat protein
MKFSPACAVLLTTLTLAATNAACGQALFTAPPAARTKPALDTRLRQALPFPEASLSRKMALSLGVGYSPAHGFYLLTGAEAAEAPLRTEALRRTLGVTPQEAPRYELLARYEHYMGQEVRAIQAFTQVAILYRRQARKRWHTSPDQAEAALAGRSRSLSEIRQWRKAKSELRQSLSHRPRAWRLWDALGDTESHQAEAVVSGAGVGGSAAISQALRLDEEARASFDRAVEVAPRKGLAFAARGEFLGFGHPSLLDQVKRLRGGAAPSFETSVPSAAFADFRRAASLMPNDPYAITYPVWQEVSELGFFHLHLPFPSQAAWGAMPASTRRSAREAIQRLTQLSHNRDGRLARRADVALGFLLFETQRSVGPAEAALRLGLSGPDHQGAAEMLMHIMSLEGQNQALASFCQAEAHRQDTPRLHVIAAWAEVQQTRWPQARTQMERALALEPGDTIDLLTLAVIRMKAGGDAVGLAEAGTLLGRAEQGLRFSQPSDPQREEYRVTHGFYLALRGNANVAQKELRAVITENPRDTGAAKGFALIKKQ